MYSDNGARSILMNSSVCRYVRAIQYTLYHNYTNSLLIASDFRIVSYLLLFIFRCDEVMQEAQHNKNKTVKVLVVLMYYLNLLKIPLFA